MWSSERRIQSLDPPLSEDGELRLVLIERHPGDPKRGFVPSYVFAMTNRYTGNEMGRISLRLGDTEHIRMYAGHIGYTVEPLFRGNHYAERSCRLILPLAVSHGFREIWITCNPDNGASRRTLERLGAELIEIVDVPRGNPLWLRGERRKCRFRLMLSNEG